jgi:hypothetical protein
MSLALAHQSKTKKAVDSKTSASAKHSSIYHHIHNFHLQKTIDNQTVQNLMRSNNARGFNFAKIGIQPKLEISQPGDAYEQEADRIAEEVMTMSNSVSISRFKTGNEEREERIGRKCRTCETKEKEEQRNPNSSRKPLSSSTLEASDDITNETNNIRSIGGSSLDSSTKEFMESRFGYDFSTVSIHTGETAARSSRSINALAYTVGNDIVFGQGQYRPNTREGKRLLAHELTHVIQQNSQAPFNQQQYATQRSRIGMRHKAITIKRSSYSQISTLQQLTLQRHEDPNDFLPGENMIFDSQGEARIAALARSTELGPGYTITHDPLPARGLPHYHIVEPGGRRVRGHYFYRTRRRRRLYKVNWADVLKVLSIIGISILLLASIIAALLDPEPATKLALIGLSSAQIALLLLMLRTDGGEESEAGPAA